jgi:hypothetical protein
MDFFLLGAVVDVNVLFSSCLLNETELWPKHQEAYPVFKNVNASHTWAPFRL